MAPFLPIEPCNARLSLCELMKLSPYNLAVKICCCVPLFEEFGDGVAIVSCKPVLLSFQRCLSIQCAVSVDLAHGVHFPELFEVFGRFWLRC